MPDTLELCNSKTLYLGKDRYRQKHMYSITGYMGAVLMSEDGHTWSDIVPRLVQDSEGWHTSQSTPYYAEIKHNGDRLFCPDKRDCTKYLRIPALPQVTALEKHLDTSPIVLYPNVATANKVIIHTPFGWIRYTLSNTGLKFDVKLNYSPGHFFGTDTMEIRIPIDSTFNISTLLTPAQPKGLGIPRPRLIPANMKDLYNQPISKWLGWEYKNGELVLKFDFTGLKFPILLKNTTIDVKTAATADDGRALPDSSYYDNDQTSGNIGCYSSGSPYEFYARWDNITFGGEVTTAYLKLYCIDEGAGSPETLIYMVDEDDHSAPSNYDYATYNGLAKTTASTTFDPSPTESSWEQTGSIVSQCEEIRASYSPSNEAIGVKIVDDLGSGANWCAFAQYDYDDNTYGPNFYAEYTSGNAWEENASVIIGVVASADRTYAGTRNSSVSIGQKVTASRTYAGGRDSSVSIGLVATASRTLASVRKATVSIGQKVTASKQVAWSRESSISIGILVEAAATEGGEGLAWLIIMGMI